MRGRREGGRRRRSGAKRGGKKQLTSIFSGYHGEILVYFHQIDVLIKLWS